MPTYYIYKLLGSFWAPSAVQFPAPGLRSLWQLLHGFLFIYIILFFSIHPIFVSLQSFITHIKGLQLFEFRLKV